MPHAPRRADGQGLRERVRAGVLVVPRRGGGGGRVPQRAPVPQRRARAARALPPRQAAPAQHAAHPGPRAVLHRVRGACLLRVYCVSISCL